MGAVGPCSTSITLVGRAHGPSSGVVPTRASLEAQTGNHVRALALERRIEQRFLEALQPDQVTLALAALAQLEQEEQAESKQGELRLERARYQAKRAERQ